MTDTSGAALRQRRERLGVSRLQVSKAIGLTVEALAALEAGTPHKLTRPPRGELYRKSYAAYLDRVAAGRTVVPSEMAAGATSRLTGPIDPSSPSEVTSPIHVEGDSLRVPLSVVRVVAALSTLIALGLVGWGLSDLARRPAAPAAPGAVQVRLVLQRNAHLIVHVDGVVVEDRMFSGREEVTFEAARDVDVWVPDIEAAHAWFNGRRIEPRGKTGVPRTLAFSLGDGEG